MWKFPNWKKAKQVIEEKKVLSSEVQKNLSVFQRKKKRKEKLVSVNRSNRGPKARIVLSTVVFAENSYAHCAMFLVKRGAIVGIRA